VTPNSSFAQNTFATTRWSLIQAAGGADSPAARAALEMLCQNYWQPIYAFVRRFGHGREDAEDLTQEFFQQLLERNYPGKADPRKGRFRTFLVITLNHFLLDQRARQHAQKRGGGKAPISIDAAAEEERLSLEPLDELTPEAIFERRWAASILGEAERRLQLEFEAGGQALEWQVLQHFLPGAQGSLSYADAAARLGIAENTFKSKVHRMRQRHRELVRATVAETVATPAEVEAELRHLIALLAG
jgi:RNA polymerase sigma-70 factor (ECF subfamily)